MEKNNENPYIEISDLDQNLEVFDGLREKAGTKNRIINALQTLLGLSGIILIFLSFINSSYFFVGALLIVARVYWKKSESPENYHIQQARTLYRKKKYEKSIPHFNQLMKFFPDEPYLKLMKAESLMRIGERNNAFELYKKTLISESEHKIDTEKADKHYVNTMNLAADHADWQTIIILGRITEKIKNREFHMRLYSHYYLGMAFYHTESLKDAKYHFNKVFQLNSEFKNVKKVLKGLNKGENIDELLTGIH